MARNFYYFRNLEVAIRFMKCKRDGKMEDDKYRFHINDWGFQEKPSTMSIDKKLNKLIKGSNKPLTEQRTKEILAEINELIHQWPQLRVL